MRSPFRWPARSRPPAIAEPWLRDAAAVAEALFASRGPDGALVPAPADRVAWLCDDLDHFVTTVGGRTAFVFRAGLQALVLAGPPAVWRATPFWSLPIDQRVRALERLEHSPAALALFAVKTLLCLHWYEHPDSAVEVGLHRNVRALRPRGGA